MHTLMRHLPASLLVLLSATASWAGMDDTQSIAQITGKVEVSGPVARGPRPSGHRLRVDRFVHWVPAKAGDVLGPGCSVRTAARSSVRLLMGDSSSEHLRKGDVALYTIVQPDTLIHLHGYHSKAGLLEVVRGKVIRQRKRI